MNNTIEIKTPKEIEKKFEEFDKEYGALTTTILSLVITDFIKKSIELNESHGPIAFDAVIIGMAKLIEEEGNKERPEYTEEIKILSEAVYNIAKIQQEYTKDVYKQMKEKAMDLFNRKSIPYDPNVR